MSDDDILEIARECMTQRQLNYTEALQFARAIEAEVKRDELAKSIKRGRKLIPSHDFFQTDKKQEKLKPKDFAKR